MATIAEGIKLTYDDVLLEPGYTDFTLDEIDISSELVEGISLAKPIISAPMDTVTESPLAIRLAQLGGIGIIHRNLSSEAQATEVEKVKAQKLFVGAAIGTQEGFAQRLGLLVDAGVDVIVIDSAQGWSKFALATLTYAKDNFPRVPIIAGNIATAKAAEALIGAGAKALRVGVGPGAICTTRTKTGMGVPQVSAIMQTAEVALSFGIPIIADGGVNYPGDLTKAIAAGASSVMLGRLLAQSKESPGKLHKIRAKFVPDRFKDPDTPDDKIMSFKEYRGMGSRKAIQQARKANAGEEYHGKDVKKHIQTTEGVTGLVPYKGPLKNVVGEIIEGLKRGMQDVGQPTLEKLFQNAEFQQITQASLAESHPHHIWITEE